MNSTKALSASIVLLALTICDASAVPINRTFQIGFTRNAQAGSAPTFDLRMSGVSFNDEVVAPSGRTYGTFGALAPANLTESQLYSELIGTWTIKAFTNFGQPAEVHQFNFASFSADDFFHEVPTIVSPTAGSTVPPNFVLSWIWPPGVVPPGGRGAGAAGGAQGASLDFGSFNGNSIPIAVSFSGGTTQATYRLSAGSAQFLTNLTTVPTTTAVNPAYKYSVTIPYGNQTSIAGVTVVVPEPSCLVLGSVLGGAAVFARLRRKAE